MPVIIIIREDVIPAILMEETESKMLNALNGLADTPHLASIQDAKEWLAQFQQPSGWYDSPALAKAEIARLKDGERLSGVFVREARELLGLSRAAFATAIGYGGNDNTRHKTMFQVEGGEKSLSPQASRILRGLLAKKSLKEAERA